MSASHVAIRLRGMCFIKTLTGKNTDTLCVQSSASLFRLICGDIHNTMHTHKKWWTVKQPICLADVTARAFRKHSRVGVCGALWHFPIKNNEKPPSAVWEATLCLRPLSTPVRKKKTKHPVVHSLPGSFHPVCSSSVANDIGFSHRGIWEATRSQALFVMVKEWRVSSSHLPLSECTAEERGPCWHPSILIVPHL